MEKLQLLYTKWCGHAPASVTRLQGAGSNRVYYRLTDTDGASVIGCVGTSSEENNAFVYLSRHFTERQLPVPRILAVDDDGMRYLQTDLGTHALFDALREGREAGGRYAPHEVQLLRTTLRMLPHLQVRGAEGLDWSQCYPQPAFDADNVFFDLHYFKYCFLKPSGLDFHELRLEEDFRRMAQDLTGEEAKTFMYRDFQARNVMLTDDGQPMFIDYQGGRRGPYYYDVASFLWQASARYSQQLRDTLVEEYYHTLRQLTEVPPLPAFRQRLSCFVLFRTLQVLGAYGFRGYFERKAHFLQSIPPALDNLRALLATPFPYPCLMDVLKRLTELPRYARPKTEAEAGSKPSVSRYDGQGPLVVRVFSFSYKKGIPADTSGNGGGYVFDCRSTHNPGRYEQYKQLTGLDEPVIQFLEQDGEILTFLESVYRLADAHVARYMERGFTSLMFCFGCTGGQHRSVYSAQHLAEHIHEKFGIEVVVEHRERHIRQVWPARV